MYISRSFAAVWWCLVSIALGLGTLTIPAKAQSPTATSTALTVALQTNPAGVAVAKLVATVQSAGSPVTVGSVEFFDGVKKIGWTAIVQSSAAGYTPGTATLQKILGPGSHSLTAKFHPPLSLVSSTSSATQVTVPGSTTNTPALYPAGSYTLPDVAASVTVADINGDGLPDILVPMLDLGEIDIFLNDPSNPGHFTQGPILTMPFNLPPTQAVVGDVDGDGLPDILVSVDGNESGDTDTNLGEVALFLQNPGQPGTFQSPTLVLSDDVVPNNFALIDMNGDGVPDIVFAGGYLDDDVYGLGVNVAVQSPTNRGTFARASTVYTSAGNSSSAAFGDVDGDGLPDVVFSGVNNQIEVYYSDPTNPGGFSSAAYFPAPADLVSDSRLLDVNQDGHPDLILAEATAGIQIFQNDPAHPGNFLAPVTYTVPDRAIGLAIGDVNGDGIPDLIAPGYSNIFSTLAGDGKGSFASPLTYTVSSPPGEIAHVAVADLDGDGLDDVVALTGFYNYVTTPTFQLNVSLHTPSNTKPLPAIQLSAPATSSLGSPVTLSVSVTSSFGNPTGTVTFTVGTQTIGTATLSPSGAAQLTTSTLPAGSQMITAHYNGDGNFLPADSLASPIYIQGLVPTLSITASPVTGQAGTLFTFTAKASGSGPVPTGPISFAQYQNGYLPVFATATLDATGTAVATLGSLTKGQYMIESLYSGDATYGSGSAWTTITVTAGAAISLTASTPLTDASGPITFTATVTNLPSVAGLTVSFFDYTTLVYTTTTDANGVATWQNSGLSPGSHGITAQYVAVNSGGDATSNELFYALPRASTTLALSANPSSPSLGQTVALTAHVTSSVSGVVPSGPVTFTEDGAVLGTLNVDSSGSASVTTSPQTVGSHSISASYAGDSQTSNSNGALTLTVPAPDFSLTLDHSSVSVSAGQSASLNIQLSPLSGFSGTVQLSCSGLPSVASCTFSNPNPAVSASGGSSVLTISVAATSSALNQRPVPYRRWPISIAAFAALPLIFRRRRLLSSCLPLFVAALLILSLTSCGGSSTPAQPQQTAIVQVTGVSSGTTHSVSLNLTYN